MNFISKAGLWTKRHSPELLIAGSIVSMVGSLALTVIATMKVRKITNPAKDKLYEIRHNIKLIPDNSENKEELVKQYKKDMAVTYAKTAGKIALLYAPAVITTGLSITCLLGSHHIMKTRQLALASAYSILDNGFRAYRSRVKKEIGDEAEEKLYSNTSKEKVEYVDEKGKVKTKNVEMKHYNKDGDENFKVLYGCGNAQWTKNALLNFQFLMNIQDILNRKLEHAGYLTLAEVYDALGFTTAMLGKKRARAAKCLGWLYDPTNPNLDNYIDFGITFKGTRTALPKIAEQIDLNIPDFWLELNPTGDIITGDVNFTDYAKDGF